jgi:uroporphyrin-III C-methyltransferase
LPALTHFGVMEKAPPHKAHVYLVGAGPGDPELLTLKAARLIGAADVIVHDGLVDDAILALCSKSARFISVAKQRSKHSVPQDGINEILIREALAGYMVVRLKGGDPFIFGRGGEEAEACRAVGVNVEVVPGISAAIGGGAEFLLPLTHRDASSAVSFVAGQCKGLTDQDWSGLAGKDRTLVIYMGVATAADITEKLIADGVSPGTPVAVIERATRGDSRAIRTLLTDLGDMIEREKVASPAIIIVGDVVLKSDAEDVMCTLAKEAEKLA